MLPIVTIFAGYLKPTTTSKWPCRLLHMNREASNIAMFKESVPMVPSGVATWSKGSLMRVWSFKESWTKGNSTKTIQAFPRLSTYVSSYSDYPRLMLALH